MKTVYRVMAPDGSWLRTPSGRVLESADADSAIGMMLSAERSCGHMLVLAAGVSNRTSSTWFAVDLPRMDGVRIESTVSFSEVPFSWSVALFSSEDRERVYEFDPVYSIAVPPSSTGGWFVEDAVIEVAAGKAARAVVFARLPGDWPGAQDFRDARSGYVLLAARGDLLRGATYRPLSHAVTCESLKLASRCDASEMDAPSFGFT